MTTMVTKTGVDILMLGHDTLEQTLEGLTDRDVLKQVAESHPYGVNLKSTNQGPVWVHPRMLLNLAQTDSFGIELTGLAHTAAELLRLTADLDRADALGGRAVDRLMLRFAKQAQTLSVSKRVNQLHGYRWGVGCKVIGADRVEPGVVEIHPDGLIARELCTAMGIKWDDRHSQPIVDDDGYDTDEMTEGLEGRYVYVLRSPFQGGYIARIAFNTRLTRSLMLCNRLELRKGTKGDFDGDNVAVYEAGTEEQALAIKAEYEALVPDSDTTLLIRGLAADAPEAEMWGELTSKTTQQKLDQSFTFTMDQWVHKHKKMGDYANVFTPMAYRISDICALMAAFGVEGAATAALMGAVIEEDYYLGLGGGPEGLDAAMEIWMSKTLDRDNQVKLFGGLRKAVDPAVLTEDVRMALYKGALINREKLDLYTPVEVLTHFAWLIGKGWTSTNSPSSKASITAKLEALVEIAGHKDFPEELRDNVIVKMVLHAARKLAQVVGKKPEGADDIPPELTEDEERELAETVIYPVEEDDEDF